MTVFGWKLSRFYRAVILWKTSKQQLLEFFESRQGSYQQKPMLLSICKLLVVLANNLQSLFLLSL